MKNEFFHQKKMDILFVLKTLIVGTCLSHLANAASASIRNVHVCFGPKIREMLLYLSMPQCEKYNGVFNFTDRLSLCD